VWLWCSFVFSRFLFLFEFWSGCFCFDDGFDESVRAFVLGAEEDVAGDDAGQVVEGGYFGAGGPVGAAAAYIGHGGLSFGVGFSGHCFTS